MIVKEENSGRLEKGCCLRAGYGKKTKKWTE